MTDHRPSCIVVGAGIVGSSCAWHLANRGARVTLVDSELPGQSTSFGNAGCIAPTQIFPFSYPGAIWQVPGWLMVPLGPMRIRWAHLPRLMPWLWRFWRAGKLARVEAIAAAQFALMASAISDYDYILERCGSRHLKQDKGLIMLYDRPQDLEQKAWQFRLRKQFGLEWQRLGRDELRAMEPALELGQGVAVLDPAWQHLLDPGRVSASIAENAFRQGVTWLHDRVEHLREGDREVAVSTRHGHDLTADFLVIAAGAWSGSLLNQLGRVVPLASKRGYHSMVKNPTVELTYPVMGIKEFYVLTPMLGGLRVAGTAEFADLDAPPDYRRSKALMHHARQFLPQLDGDEITEWMGQRPMMPDSLPVPGQLPGHERFICAFGHGHYGITQGPTTGRIVADLVFDGKTNLDLTPYSPDRF